MSKRILSLFAAVMLAGALNAGAQAIDSFPRTTTIQPTDLLLTQTNSTGQAGQKFTRSITWSNVLESLMDFPNWTGGGGSSSTSGIFANAVYVNATGATATANGTLYTNALKSAPANSTLIIGPGTYGIPVSSMPLLRNGINQYWSQGSVLWVGVTNTAYEPMFSDQDEVVVCSIMGYGKFYGSNEVSVPIYLDRTGTKVDFECDIIDAEGTPGETSTCFLLGSGAPELNLRVRDYMKSHIYDAFYFSPSTGTKLRLKASKVYAKGDVMEMTDDSPAWGNVMIDIDYAEQIGVGQPTFLQAAGRVDIRVGKLKVNDLGACMTFYGSTNAFIHDTVIEVPVNGTNSIIDKGFTMIGTHCGAWLKNVTLYGSTNRPIFNLTNISAVPLVLDNVTLHNGWGASTWVSAPTSVSGATVKIEGGGVSLVPYRSIGANVTFSGTTNVFSGLLVRGGQTNAGTLEVAGLITATAGINSSYDVSINNGGLLYVDGASSFLGEMVVGTGLYFNNLTPNRVMFINAFGYATNVTSSSPSTEYVKADGTTGTPGGSGGTNNPILFSGGTLTLIANQTSRHQHATNASFAWTIAGSSNRSSIFAAQFQNTSTNTIYATNVNGFYSVGLGSNAITTLTIPGNSMLLVDGYLDVSNRWVLTETFAGYALEFANGTTATNHTTRAITYTAPLSPTNSVLSNLIGTVGNNLTNESSSALQINSGTLSLSPGVLSNIVASGHGAPYIAVSTNSGALANVTSLVFRSGIVLSNDSAGIASLHISASSSGTSGNLTNVSLATSASTNLIIDLGLTSSNYVVFKVAMPTNTHLVFSNASIRKWPAEIIWQQDTNGSRTITSIRSTDGLYQTNASLALTATASAMDKWTIGASYWPTNFTINSGL